MSLPWTEYEIYFRFSLCYLYPGKCETGHKSMLIIDSAQAGQASAAHDDTSVCKATFASLIQPSRSLI
jgi:hypothetical protein